MSKCRFSGRKKKNQPTAKSSIYLERDCSVQPPQPKVRTRAPPTLNRRAAPPQHLRMGTENLRSM